MNWQACALPRWLQPFQKALWASTQGPGFPWVPIGVVLHSVCSCVGVRSECSCLDFFGGWLIRASFAQCSLVEGQ
jgi:hypothetical protein